MRTSDEISAMKRKLRKAFQTLRDEGIMARMDYCLYSSIIDVPQPLDKCLVIYGQEEIGFYRETGILLIHFSTPDGDVASTRALGDQVRIVMESFGLDVEWGGDPSEALAVMDCTES